MSQTRTNPTQMPIPEGFELSPPSTSKFINLIGPFYKKIETLPDDSNQYWLGLHVGEHHSNTWGTCHGAMMSALSEMVLAGPAYLYYDSQPMVSVTTTAQFLNAPQIGDFLMGTAKVLRGSKTMAFVQGHLEVDGKIMMTSTGVWRILPVKK